MQAVGDPKLPRTAGETPDGSKTIRINEPLSSTFTPLAVAPTWGQEKMMKLTSIKLTLLLTLAGAAAQGATLLTFEGTTHNFPIGNFYNGGAGGNFGVTFDGTEFAQVEGLTVSGRAGFRNEPSRSTVLLVGNAFTGASTINVNGGFTLLDFYYSAARSDSSVSIYDGLNGTGNLLQSLALTAQPGNGFFCPSDGGLAIFFCVWTPVSIPLTSTARSLSFALGELRIDNLAFTAPQPASSVPEPSTMALTGIAAALLAACRQQRS